MKAFITPYLKRLRDFFQNPAHRTWLKIIGLSFACALCVVTAQQWFFKTPTLVRVDVNGIMQPFVKAQIQSHLPKAQMQHNIQMFAKALQLDLKQLGTHAVVLPREAILAGNIPDKTSMILQKLQTQLPQFFKPQSQDFDEGEVQ